MSPSHADSVSPPAPEQQSEKETVISPEDDSEHVRNKTRVDRRWKIETDLEFAECEQDVEDELLDASLEEYR